MCDNSDLTEKRSLVAFSDSGGVDPGDIGAVVRFGKGTAGEDPTIGDARRPLGFECLAAGAHQQTRLSP